MKNTGSEARLTWRHGSESGFEVLHDFQSSWCGHQIYTQKNPPSLLLPVSNCHSDRNPPPPKSFHLLKTTKLDAWNSFMSQKNTNNGVLSARVSFLKCFETKRLRQTLELSGRLVSNCSLVTLLLMRRLTVCQDPKGTLQSKNNVTKEHSAEYSCLLWNYEYI